MVEKNQEYILDIVSQGYEGEGIAKYNGTFPIFIEGAIKGEKVKALIVKVNKKFAYGKLLEVIEKSSARVEPKCSIYKRCGGCKIQHISYEEQLNFKYERVKDCIRKIARLPEELVKYPIGMDEPIRYRNKVQLPVGEEKGLLQIGFFAPRSHNIIDMETCLIQDEVGDIVVALTKEWMEKYNIKPYIKEGIYNEDGIVRHVMVRKGFRTGEIMVVLVTNKKHVPYIKEFVNSIKNNIDGVTSIIQNINTEKTNVILGQECITLYGEDHITDYIGKFKFKISPLSFFQVNPVQTEKLYSKALEYANLTGNEIVFDAYCGTGTITLFLSQKAKHVYGIEIVPQAIEDAKKNAVDNSVETVDYFVGKSEEVIPYLVDEGIKADVVVVDPPRKGCDVKLLQTLANSRSKRIVYVSCDPSTLARDLGILNDLGYETKEIQPVDMFPHTSHIENVALLEINENNIKKQ